MSSLVVVHSLTILDKLPLGVVSPVCFNSSFLRESSLVFSGTILAVLIRILSAEFAGCNYSYCDH